MGAKAKVLRDLLDSDRQFSTSSCASWVSVFRMLNEFSAMEDRLDALEVLMDEFQEKRAPAQTSTEADYVQTVYREGDK